MTHAFLRFTGLVGLLSLSTGCASLVSRSHPNHDRYYAGVKQDWRDLSIDPWYSQSLDLVDLPLSAVGDTLLLPWDLIVRDEHQGPEGEVVEAKSKPEPVVVVPMVAPVPQTATGTVVVPAPP
jgi:uncharacterized protein YceK